MAKKEHESALQLFKQIQQEFSELEMVLIREPQHVDLELAIPKQVGLDFDINLGLQTDELHLSTPDIHCSWFPMKDGVEEYLLHAVRGLINGEYRIIKFMRKGKVHKSQLQRPITGGWETVGVEHARLNLPWFKYEELEIRNSQI